MTKKQPKQPPPDPVHEYADPPPGYRAVWTQLPGRRVATEEETTRKCRRPGCQRKPVMALQRSNGWWLYCDWHTYGTRIEDGRALSRVLRPTAAPLMRGGPKLVPPDEP